MRVKAVLFFGIIFFQFTGNTQTMQFSWSDVSLDKCFEEIESKTDLAFYYSQEWTEGIFITLKTEPNLNKEELLNLLLDGTGLSYFLTQENVIITTQPVISQLQYNESYSRSTKFSRELGGTDNVLVIGSRGGSKSTATISGTVVDINNQPVGAALVYVEKLQKSVTTSRDGKYSMNLPVGLNEIQIQSLGFETKFQDVLIYSDGSFDVTLEEQAMVLEDVYVLGGDLNVSSTTTGLTKLDIEEVKTIPKVFGENDVVQVALALPGVQSVGEGAAGINVRGGKTDQNLVLFNDITLYNPFHFFGFFSAFNADIIKSTDLYKGSIPAEYGGRLSSILKVEMKNGQKEEFSGKLGISPVTSKASVTLPVIKDKLSIVAGGRATYSDWITNTVDNSTIKNSDPSFFDIASNVHAQLGEKHSIEAFGYYSKDRFRLTIDSLFTYFNLGSSLKWNYQITNDLSLETTAAYSKYDFNVSNNNRGAESFDYGFTISDTYFKTKLNLDKKTNSYSLGFDARLYDLEPGFIRPRGSESLIEEETLDQEKGRELSLFLSDDFEVLSNLKGSFGFRYSLFSALGPRSVNLYEEGNLRNDASLLDTREFSSGEVIDTYSGPEFRVSLNYLLNDNLSFKANFTTMRQYIHSLSNTVSVSPLDTWKLSDPNFKPQTSSQYSAGLYKNIGGNAIEASIEVYQKEYNNIVDYKVGADLILNPLLERDIIQGEGRSRGIELLIRKKTGKLTGWIGYTYSRSEQRFASEFVDETINQGRYFPANFDKPHDLSVISNYKINRRFSTSLNVVFTSGRPVTYPTAKYVLSDREIVHFGDRNEFRIPNYFRIDFGINMEPSHKKDNLLYTYWSFSVYNLLGRNNAYSVFFRGDENGEIQGYQLSVLASAIPSITYNVIF